MFPVNITKPSQSNWAALIISVPEKDGTLRFWVDYHNLNEVTKRHWYLITRMDECVNFLGDAIVLSTLDSNSCYRKIKIADANKSDSAFTLHHGIHRFIQIPFGLRNFLGKFRHAIDLILSSVNWQFPLAYVNDSIMFNNTPEQHISQVCKVLPFLHNVWARLKLKTRNFFTDKIV